MIVSHHTARAVQRPAAISHWPGNSESSPSDLRVTRLQPLYMSCDNVGGAHASVAASICIPPHERFSKLSRDAPPVGRGLTFVPGNVQTRICAITAQHSLIPTSYSHTAIGRLCSLLSPKGAIRGFHVPPKEVHWVRCLLSTEKHMRHEDVRKNRPSRFHCHFGSSVQATSACQI